MKAVGFLLFALLIKLGTSSKCIDSCLCFGNVVDCEGKGLKDIPKDIPAWAVKLNLSKNPKLQLKNDSFSSLPNLSTLHLDRLKLLELPNIGVLRSMKTITLVGNKIEKISSEWLQNFASLTELDLAKNFLISFDPQEWIHKNLRKINLNSNQISSIPVGNVNLPSLTSLKLGGNAVNDATFRNLTLVLQSLPKLKTLDLNSNSIETLEGLMFQNMTNITIRTLKLRKNKIRHLRDGAFYGLQSLVHLQLDANENITEINDGWLFGLDSLKSLTISHNKVETIKEKSWTQAKQLEILDVSFNDIGCKTSNPTFRGLMNLKKLYVSHNCLSNLNEETFQQLSKLQILDLKNNQIQWSIEDSTGAFKDLNSLRELNLANNKIERIHGEVFSTLISLWKLDLSGNGIKVLSQNPFKTLDNLKHLSLNTTSLVCNCHIIWLPPWLEEHNFSVNVKCGYPQELQGKSVYDLPIDAFSCSVSPQPKLTEFPKNSTVLYGSNVTLTCKAITGGDKPNFMWIKDRNTELPFKMKTFVKMEHDENYGTPIYEVTSQLNISNITQEHGGYYQCIARNSFGPSYSEQAKITVHRFPYFITKPVSVEVKEGNSAELNCKAGGYPPPEISWNKVDEVFYAARDRRLHYLSGDSISFIKPVKKKDEGEYICMAKNKAGVISSSMVITILNAPNFTRPVNNQIVEEGQSAVLECQGTGQPKPNATWRKDGRKIELNENITLLDDDQFLLILKAKKEDGGIYTCNLTNTLGIQTRNISLRVVAGTFFHLSYQEAVYIALGIVLVFVLLWIFTVAFIKCRTRSSTKENKRRNVEDAKTAPLLTEPLTVSAHDNGSEHSSGKDSGVGDTIQDDLRKNELTFNFKHPEVSERNYYQSDDIKPPLSTFESSPHLMYATLRRGSSSKLMPVPSPKMPRNGMSLPRSAYKTNSLSHPKRNNLNNKKFNTTQRTHRCTSPPRFLKDRWREDDDYEMKNFEQPNPNRNPVVNNYSDPKSFRRGDSEFLYLPTR